MLSDYLGKCREIQGINLHPIKLLEWEEFEQYANQFLLYGDRFIKYKLKIKQDFKIFDLMISMISSEVINSNSEDCEILKNFERMFEMVLHKPVMLVYDSKDKQWIINFDGGRINRENYDVIRQNIMEMNLIHEPLIAPNEMSQKILDNAIRSMNKGGGKVDLESMIVYVCTYAKVSPTSLQEITYYQLRAQFEMCQRIQFSDAVHIYRSQGAKVELVNVAEKLSIHENPYSFDKLVKKVDAQKEEQTRKALGG